jgi:hypothetical protein
MQRVMYIKFPWGGGAVFKVLSMKVWGIIFTVVIM